MRLFTIVPWILIVLTQLAEAQGVQPSTPNECVNVAQKIANKMQGTIESRPSRPFEIQINMQTGPALVIMCSADDHKQPSILIRSLSIYPGPSFYKLLADAGHELTGISIRRLNKGAHNCHRASVGALDGRAKKGVRGLNFECHTSAKDGFSTFKFHRKSEHRP